MLPMMPMPILLHFCDSAVHMPPANVPACAGGVETCQFDKSLQMCSLSIISPEFAVDGSAGFRLSELRCAIGLAIGIAFLACAAIAAREPPQHE